MLCLKINCAFWIVSTKNRHVKYHNAIFYIFWLFKKFIWSILLLHLSFLRWKFHLKTTRWQHHQGWLCFSRGTSDLLVRPFCPHPPLYPRVTWTSTQHHWIKNNIKYLKITRMCNVLKIIHVSLNWTVEHFGIRMNPTLINMIKLSRYESELNQYNNIYCINYLLINPKAYKTEGR